MLLDTSGILSLCHRRESAHSVAQALFHSARRKLTHNYVLAEFVALAHARGLPRRPSLLFVAGVLENPAIEVTWADEVLHRAAMNPTAGAPGQRVLAV